MNTNNSQDLGVPVVRVGHLTIQRARVVLSTEDMSLIEEGKQRTVPVHKVRISGVLNTGSTAGALGRYNGDYLDTYTSVSTAPRQFISAKEARDHANRLGILFLLEVDATGFSG